MAVELRSVPVTSHRPPCPENTLLQFIGLFYRAGLRLAQWLRCCGRRASKPWHHAGAGAGATSRRVAGAQVLALTLLLSGCGGKPPLQPTESSLLNGALESQWSAAGIPDEGPVSVAQGVIRLGAGLPMTGVRFTGAWDSLNLPWIDYVLTFEAQRVEGQDFFATCTFPVGSPNRCVSLVLGGWGGGLVGISNIDHQDASENMTRAERSFENGRWYRVRIEVREDDLQVWIDDAPMVNVSIKGRRLELRSGDIDHCTPLGFASWRTVGEIRAVKITRLAR